ncbi:MAG: glycosyltransferase family 4 protein [Corynebacterium sp.]|nr:glycosyltransferase family 4 protein [Corynebacterium sp.]
MKILLLCWRDTGHPLGGGAERYLQRVGEYLAAHGHEVTYFSARGPEQPSCDTIGGVKHLRRGGKFSVYLHGLWHTLTHRYDRIVDTHNGIPFFARLTHPSRTVLLIHHCHREQWPIAGRFIGRLGWFLESHVSPLVYRGSPQVTVSEPSKRELEEIGFRITDIIYNGVDRPRNTHRPHPDGRTHIVTLSRLTPHKQVEHAIDCVAALAASHPDLVLDIIGSGWWDDHIRSHAAQSPVAERIIVHGQVSEERKHELLAAASVLLMPSVKEGWGLAVIEAGLHGVPAVGYCEAAGLTEAIINGHTGFTVTGFPALVDATDRLLNDDDLRTRLGEQARSYATTFSWEHTGARWQQLLEPRT